MWSQIIDRIKPSQGEICRLAEQEANPAYYARFTPIARGPLFALLGLAVILILAVPTIIIRMLFRRAGKAS